MDPETFFPAPSEPPDTAIGLCRTCDVQGPCLAWALDAGDCHGVWGGTTARERRAMLVAWRAGTERELADREPAAADFVAPEFGDRELLPLLPAAQVRATIQDGKLLADLVPAAAR